jgi:hypothetical protein
MKSGSDTSWMIFTGADWSPPTRSFSIGEYGSGRVRSRIQAEPSSPFETHARWSGDAAARRRASRFLRRREVREGPTIDRHVFEFEVLPLLADRHPGEDSRAPDAAGRGSSIDRAAGGDVLGNAFWQRDLAKLPRRGSACGWAASKWIRRKPIGIQSRQPGQRPSRIVSWILEGRPIRRAVVSNGCDGSAREWGRGAWNSSDGPRTPSSHGFRGSSADGREPASNIGPKEEAGGIMGSFRHLTTRVDAAKRLRNADASR